MNAKVAMFEKYPDVVEVDQLREMLGGISRKLAYKLLSEKEIHSVRIGRTYRFQRHVSLNTYCAKKCVTSRLANLSLPAID